ncbi:Adaptor protein complex beta subunit [Metschnikowia bicuspidata var. bicuspidata NRRL YB-4993]|uniref:AP complex subunit beta n=1 Tax=Metschnikowia bicuspidata var. bicuspidata NRRL YB-4993 TaxID=869754 RepID=A0A1A0H5B3_9ASCO|nr:Adaptor protein complex beta subunit [Metschnikowia bicuspidata var. bicuspidata NRRL YB-4993]OBA19140.1 Adaptor protein complex beta subunit [Metschnikowia bicuspidata var. bicuspidata NRRL YB-4993]
MDAKFFGKSKASELRAELEQARKKLKPQQRVRAVLKKVVANIILNRPELALLMPDIIGLMAIDDYEVRRLCCHYIVHYAELNPAEAEGLLAFFARFVADLDPMLRSLAIKTVSDVPLRVFSKMAFLLVPFLLVDQNPHVRTRAAFAVAKLYQHDAKTTVAHKLIESLNNLLYDDNQMVVANALAALHSITESLGSMGLSINKDNLLRLMRSAAAANEWRQVYLLNALMAYVPQSCQDAIEVLETVVPALLHENAAVVLNGIKVILYLSNYIDTPELVVPGLPAKLGAVLVSLLSKPPELQFLVLRNIILLLLGKKYLMAVDVELFFWKFDDPIYIKDTKLEIIYLLANETNIDVVFRELEEYATEVDSKMARKAIRAFGNLALKSEAAAASCVDILVDLISNDISYIVQEASVVIKNILRKYPGKFSILLDSIVRHYKSMEDADAKLAITWMVGQFCQQIPSADAILTHLLASFNEEPLDVQYAMITAVVKYYVHFPHAGEALVLNVLKWATEETDNPDLRDRGFFYWRLITHLENGGADEEFQSRTKEIVININPEISSESEKIDPMVLEELELNIGSLASIYLKPVKHVFRLAKKKLLPPSPALQPRRKPDLSYHVNSATLQPIERPPRREHLKPLPLVDRNLSSSSFGTNSSRASADNSKKESFGQKLSRKASVMTWKKSMKH